MSTKWNNLEDRKNINHELSACEMEAEKKKYNNDFTEKDSQSGRTKSSKLLPTQDRALLCQLFAKELRLH